MAKVIVGMSGGVDSSVAALLLKAAGHEVIGLFMRNWDAFVNNDLRGNKELLNEQCVAEKDYEDALAVAKKLAIPLHRIDFVQEYWDYVFAHFITEYERGRTPNPDILCNKYIKFDKFMNYAKQKFNADFIAMGHYAKTIDGELFTAQDETKDQTYFLAQLSREQLMQTLFPLANYQKSEIRALAAKAGLVTAAKKDSTGICFIGERDFTAFLENYIPHQPGTIVDLVTQQVVGKHIGIMYYTIGQRKGLNLGGMKEPYYVAGHDLAAKIIYVAPASQRHFLVSDQLEASDLNLNTNRYNINNITAKFRYRQKAVPVTIKIKDRKVSVYYRQGFEAVTPGQQIVFYDQNKCLGGATIEQIFRNGKAISYLQ